MGSNDPIPKKRRASVAETKEMMIAKRGPAPTGQRFPCVTGSAHHELTWVDAAHAHAQSQLSGAHAAALAGIPHNLAQTLWDLFWTAVALTVFFAIGIYKMSKAEQGGGDGHGGHGSGDVCAACCGAEDAHGIEPIEAWGGAGACPLVQQERTCAGVQDQARQLLTCARARAGHRRELSGGVDSHVLDVQARPLLLSLDLLSPCHGNEHLPFSGHARRVRHARHCDHNV